MSDTVPFEAFEKYLDELGFTQGSVPGSHVWYEHAPSGTIIMARLHGPKDPVPWHTLASARKVLVERGLAAPEDFDKLTRAAVA
jgi:predicted RNA binding protein YcfA (HicA-like mRNA interferase family)